MNDFILRIIEMFIAFFLANIAARRVNNYYDNREKNKLMKNRHDKQMAYKIIDLIDRKTIKHILNRIGSGDLYDEDIKKLDGVYFLGNNDEFYDDKVQVKFKTFKNNVGKLNDFTAREFSSSEEKGHYKIHKYRKVTKGHEMYQKNLKELQSILDDVEESFYDLNDIIRDKYPSIFLEEQN